MQHRPLRVSKLIREALSEIIARELEFGGALVTITEVEIDKKIEHAKIWVSILPQKKEKDALRVLRSAQGNLQHLLLKKINIKPMPRIAFEIDRGPGEAAKVEKLLLHE